MLLSAVVHAAPVLGLPLAVGSCPELDPSPIPTEQPRGVSLVYIEELATSALERVERAPHEGSTRDNGMRPANAARPAPREVEPRPCKHSREPSSDSQPTEGLARDTERLAQTVERRAKTATEPTEIQTTAYVEGTPLIERRIVEWRQLDIERPNLVAMATPAPARSPQTNATSRPSDSRDLRATEALPSVRGRQRPQQDRERVIAMIKERIARVMPLVYWNTARKGQRVGQARVRFRMDRRGYVRELEIIEVEGVPDISDATHAVLHLAEPYVFVPGWIELELAFRG